jgi:hypothetical protein
MDAVTAVVVWHRFPERPDMSWTRIGGPGRLGPRVTVQVAKLRVGWSIWVASELDAGTPEVVTVSGAWTESGARNRGLRIARRYQQDVRGRRSRVQRV